MDVVTITNNQDVGLMKTKDIRTWISLHQRSLKDENMEEHWESIEKYLEVLKTEYDLRYPLVNILREIKEVLDNIQTSIIQLKGDKNGNTKN